MRVGLSLTLVRHCKSYENNPVGIWSLTID